MYIKIQGYLREEKQLEGIDPKILFVPVKLLEHDTNRGCNLGVQQGG